MVSAEGGSLPRRVATAVVAIPVVIVAVVALPTAGAAVVLAVVAFGASLEWSRIAAPGGTAGYGFALVVVGSLLLLWLAASHWRGWLMILCAASLVWWCVALVWVVRFEQGRDAAALDDVVTRGLVGWFVIVPAWAGLVHLLHARDDHGPWPVLLVFLVVWAADIGAYFAGRRFGSHRLAATTSPGKSVEGVAGGMAAVAVVGTVVGLWLGLTAGLAVALTVMCIVVAAFSVLGDLTESLVKRRGGVKDSGSILPGHGGILDRIDSLTAAVPAFAIGIDILDVLSRADLYS